MAERIPWIGDVQIPTSDGQMLSIRKMCDMGMDMKTILQNAHQAALTTALLYPEVSTVPTPEELMEGMGEGYAIYAAYALVELSETPVQREARRVQEIRDDEARGEVRFYDWIW